MEVLLLILYGTKLITIRALSGSKCKLALPFIASRGRYLGLWYEKAKIFAAKPAPSVMERGKKQAERSYV